MRSFLKRQVPAGNPVGPSALCEGRHKTNNRKSQKKIKHYKVKTKIMIIFQK